MLKGLERRYTLEQIEAQHEDKIRPRLNYNALQTLKSPLYVKFGQQVQDASKEQHAQRLVHQQTQQTINNIANHNGVNAAELEHILRNLMGELQEPPDTEEQGTQTNSSQAHWNQEFRPQRRDPDDDASGGGATGGGSASSTPASYDVAGRYPNEQRRVNEWPHRRIGGGGPTAAMVPNNEMYRISLELQAENQRLKQEADMKARQHAARLEATTPHKEELRSIVQHFHQHTGQVSTPAPPQDNSQLIGALQTIANQNHAMGQVLEEKNMAARNMVELAHASMIAQMEAQRGQNAPMQPPTAAPLVSAQPPSIASSSAPQPPPAPPAPPAPSAARLNVPRMVRSRSPPTEPKLDPKKDARMPAAPAPEPLPLPVPEPPRATTPAQRVLPEAPLAPTPELSQPRILPQEPRAPTRSRSHTPAPKLAPQAVPVQPAASSSSKGDEMRAIIAILEGPERAKSAEPAPVPQNPPSATRGSEASMPTESKAPAKTPEVKKSAKILKQLKAQDKKAERAETREILKKGLDEFFNKKAAPKATARAKTVPPQQMPALSFDEMAAELEQGSFLDNPVGLRKRDTRAREAEVTAASLRPRSSASSSAQPESAQRGSIAAVRPRSGSAAVRPRAEAGARILKTQRADSEGQRRITRTTMLR